MILGGHEREVRCKSLSFQDGHRLRGAVAPGWKKNFHQLHRGRGYVKHDTPLLFTPSGANHEQGLGWDSVCEAQRSNESPSGAFKRQRGLAQARWRGVAPTSATPTRSLRKCRRIAEVKSQWSTTFSRIENLWPRDGSCPLPLRSKRIFNKCFQIIKTQKISSGALLM